MIIVTIAYLLILGFLGWIGYKQTKTAADYLVAGRNTHPYIMAMSYGATFISTSAIIGFGGAAGIFGLGLLWLTFLNIFVGIFIAFIFLGKRTRSMGHHLDAHTFPELLGKRYQSKFIQIFSGSIILTMVLYASVVLIGAARYLQETFQIGFDISLFIFALIIIIYVIAGGMKGVMYTDAFQGTIMFIGMLLLLFLTFSKVGGVKEGHEKLAELNEKAYAEAVVAFKDAYNASGAAVLLDDAKALELVPYFGKVLYQTKDKSDEDKKAISGKIFQDAETATGIKLGEYFGPAVKLMGEQYKKNLGNLAALSKFKDSGHQGWTKMPKGGSPFWWLLVSTIIMGVGIGVLAQPQLSVRFMTVKSKRELNRAVLIGGIFILVMTGVAFIVGALSNVYFYDVNPNTKGMISIIAAKGNGDLIIPTFLTSALPSWFNYIFMLTLLSAAMSTLSSQFHAMGTALSRDIFETLGFVKEVGGKKSIVITKVGIAVMLLITVIIGYFLPEGYIAAGTALFFGLCAATFLPAYVGGLYWKRATRTGAIASIITGFAVSLFWLLLVHVFTISKWGGKSIFGKSVWSMVDPLLVALPISAVVYIVVSLFSKPLDKQHVDGCVKS